MLSLSAQYSGNGTSTIVYGYELFFGRKTNLVREICLISKTHSF